MSEPVAEATSKIDPSTFRTLIVDNESSHAQVVRESLERVGYRCEIATSGPDGRRSLQRNTYDILVTDLMMNEVDGMALLEVARDLQPNCEVIIMTGHGTVSRAVEAMQQGAFTFLEKPLTSDRLRAVMEKAVASVHLRRTNAELHSRLDKQFGFEGIIYASAQMTAIIERLKRIAPTDASVIITGDTGTGKELIAQAIHQNSPRKKKPFVALNCAALSEHLLESELFGHVKGAYTDAAGDRVGRFQYAHGGTLFLDEVGDMPLSTQIKLLRVLENGQIVRVGENEPTEVNVRILSATNRDLELAISAGTFRSDLYHRLKVVSIDLPRLADRRDDIIPLIDHFRREFAKRHHKTIKGVAPTATRHMLAFDWPGNVRQLRNVIESMVVIDIDGMLDVDDLPPEIQGANPTEAAALGEAPSHLIGRPMEEIERWAIEQTLTLCGGNREETAKTLGIGARTLYRKIKEYGMKSEEV